MRWRISCDIDLSVSCAISCERYLICLFFCVESSISLIPAWKRQISKFGRMGGRGISNISTSHPLVFKYNVPSVQKKGNTQLHFSLFLFFPSKCCFQKIWTIFEVMVVYWWEANKLVSSVKLFGKATWENFSKPKAS